MEKIWFRHFRLHTFTLIGLLSLFSFQLHAESEPKSVVVDIEVPVDNNNLAEAKAVAQKQAFEKAVDQVLPATMDPQERQQKIKSALQYVKTFKVIEEKSDTTVLKQKYRVDIAYQPVETSLPILNGETATFEVNWIPDEIRFNTVDLFNFIKETLGTPATSPRIGRGNVTFTVALRKSLEETQNQIASFVGKRGLVKLIRKDADVNSNQLTPTIPVPSATPGFGVANESPAMGAAPMNTLPPSSATPQSSSNPSSGSGFALPPLPAPKATETPTTKPVPTEEIPMMTPKL